MFCPLSWLSGHGNPVQRPHDHPGSDRSLKIDFLVGAGRDMLVAIQIPLHQPPSRASDTMEFGGSVDGFDSVDVEAAMKVLLNLCGIFFKYKL